MSEKTEIRRLPIERPDDKALNAGTMAADAVLRLGVLKAEKKAAADAFNLAIKTLEAEIVSLSAQAMGGVEMGEVECVYETTRDGDDFKRVTYRAATGEFVEERAATNDEINDYMQATLPLEARGARNGRRVVKDVDEGPAEKLPDDDDEDPDYGEDWGDGGSDNVAHLPAAG